MNGPQEALLRWARFAALFIESNPYEPADMLAMLREKAIAEGLGYINGVSEEFTLAEAVRRETTL